MSGGSISEEESETSGRGAGKWESRFHKQVEANNLLSEKLRGQRGSAFRVIERMKKENSKMLTKLINSEAMDRALTESIQIHAEKENELQDT